MIGFRVLYAFFGNIPLVFLIVGLPIYAIWVGDAKVPTCLISDLLAMPKYGKYFVASMCVAALSSSFTLHEYSRFLRKRVPAIEPTLDKIMAGILIGIAPGLFLLIAFDFSENEDDSHIDDISNVVGSMSTDQFITYIVHCGGATAVFWGFMQTAVLYMFGVRPYSIAVEPGWDRAIKNFYFSLLVLGTPIAGVVRVLHLFHGRIMWTIPLLIAEQFLIGVACLIPATGFLQTMHLMDCEEPAVRWENMFRVTNLSDDELRVRKKLEAFNANDHEHPVNKKKKEN